MQLTNEDGRELLERLADLEILELASDSDSFKITRFGQAILEALMLTQLAASVGPEFMVDKNDPKYNN